MRTRRQGDELKANEFFVTLVSDGQRARLRPLGQDDRHRADPADPLGLRQIPRHPLADRMLEPQEPPGRRREGCRAPEGRTFASRRRDAPEEVPEPGELRPGQGEAGAIRVAVQAGAES